MLACAATRRAREPEPERRAVVDAGAGRALGPELYALHCAVCHGDRGAGDGPAAAHLFPPARDFTQGRFRLVTSTNGVPSDADLAATLRRGMPGSAMPSWAWMSERDLTAVVGQVRALAIDGMAERFCGEGGAMTPSAARALARERMAPGPPIALEPARAPDLERGKELYASHCAACHGEDGRGTPAPRRDEDGGPNWARDFTAGVLKGGASPAALAARIRLGLPGSAMPPTELSARDEAALVAWVRSLIPEDSEDRYVLRRASVRALRAPHALPVDPDDPDWSAADQVEVGLAPLWWHEDAVFSVTLSALHDGQRIAFCLRWRDPSGGTRLFSAAPLPDGVALQFSDAAAPPLFGMGSPERPTNLWHWRSILLEEIAGALELFDPTAHTLAETRPGEVRLDAPVYRPLYGVPAVSARVDRVHGEGIPRTDPVREAAAVEVTPRWSDGEWRVVLSRAMAPAAPDETPLLPGSRVQVACAVWNGSAGDQGAQKSISVWQEVVIAP